MWVSVVGEPTNDLETCHFYDFFLVLLIKLRIKQIVRIIFL